MQLDELDMVNDLGHVAYEANDHLGVDTEAVEALIDALKDPNANGDDILAAIELCEATTARLHEIADQASSWVSELAWALDRATKEANRRYDCDDNDDNPLPYLEV